MMKTVLVGLGRIGFQFHLPALLAHPAFSLCAVVDVDPARLAEVSIPGYTDLETCLSEVKPSLVVIASPTHLHCEQTLLCFEHGADVFLDKPMTPTADQARILQDAAKRMGRKLMVYQPHRVTDEFETAKGILASGVLGRIYHVRRAVHRFRRRADWQAFSSFGGGMLMNYGAHYIDQLLALTKAHITEHFCFTDAVATLGDAEDVVECLFKTEEGILLSVSICEASPIPHTPWEIFGEYGSAVFDPNSRTFRITRFDPATLPDTRASRDLAAKDRSYHSGEVIEWISEEVPLSPAVNYYDHCADYFCNNHPPFLPMEESVALIELLDSLKQR